jgi:hypothetical protein
LVCLGSTGERAPAATLPTPSREEIDLKRLCAALALLAASAGALAATPIWGVGETRCDAYLSGNAADPRYADWISGYIIGQSVASQTPDLTTAADMDTLRAWLPAYCRAHPEDRMMSAAVAFMRENGLPMVKRVRFGAPEPAPRAPQRPT